MNRLFYGRKVLKAPNFWKSRKTRKFLKFSDMWNFASNLHFSVRITQKYIFSKKLECFTLHSFIFLRLIHKLLKICLYCQFFFFFFFTFSKVQHFENRKNLRNLENLKKSRISALMGILVKESLKKSLFWES